MQKIWLILTLSLFAAPSDQFTALFGSNGYILYKVIDFANDHGYSYIKILDYEFHGFDHDVAGKAKESPAQGRIFELYDDFSRISFLAMTQKPSDPFIIDVEKYRYLLNQN